jgi:tetratricopeptide (TPR) repeat protein
MQRIGITDIIVNYSRPGVKGRKIWGEVVPFDGGKPIPWRAGANENTTITFTHDVSIEGKPLAAGTYGFHTIPSATDWTIIFSKNSTSWGSYSYKESEDALRVTVKSRAGEFREYLTYTFEDVLPESATLQLAWEKVQVPINISVDVKKIVVENIRKELRNNIGFSWVGYNSAAWFCYENNTNLEEALKWADQSIAREARYENLDTKGQILIKLGKKAQGDSVMRESLVHATPAALYGLGRQMLAEKKLTDAKEIFDVNIKHNPKHWTSFAGMARYYDASGDKDKAIKNIKKAKEVAPEQIQPGLDALLKEWGGM